MNNYIVNKFLSIFLIVELFLIGVAAKYPHLVEKYYSQGIYPYISGFMRRILGWIPFSVSDILYILLFIIILRWLWHVIQTRFTPFTEQVYKVAAFAAVIIFLFHLLWGMNYYRVPLYKQLDIKSLEYDTIALQKTTQRHINQLNSIHLKLVNNDSIVPKIELTIQQIQNEASYKNDSFVVNTKDFKLKYQSIKNSLFSRTLTFMGFTGYINPFTNEAQINKKIPLSTYPVTVLHEMAHQLGYASESEANYLGYLGCINHSNLYFQYSGESMAVKYLIQEVATYNPELANEYFKRLNQGVQNDFQLSKDFWDSYSSFLKPISFKVYDQFLKANKQSEGLKSYNEVISYLIND